MLKASNGEIFKVPCNLREPWRWVLVTRKTLNAAGGGEQRESRFLAATRSTQTHARAEGPNVDPEAKLLDYRDPEWACANIAADAFEDLSTPVDASVGADSAIPDAGSAVTDAAGDLDDALEYQDAEQLSDAEKSYPVDREEIAAALEEPSAEAPRYRVLIDAFARSGFEEITL